MARWAAKAVVQKGITVLPRRAHHPLNGLLQRYVTRGTLLSDVLLQRRLAVARIHRDAGANAHGQPVLELGTGWYPIVPLSLFLAGFEQVGTIDLVSHCNPGRSGMIASRLLAMHDVGDLEPILGALDDERVVRLRAALTGSVGEPKLDLQGLGIQVLVGDASSLRFADRSIGLISSNNVFEHIYPEVLAGILGEFRRVLRDDGVMSHGVDMSDHFAHVDHSITPYNFLKFSDRQWRFIDNSIQPQSRQRVDDYRGLVRRMGFQVLSEKTKGHGLDVLRSVKLAERFRRKSEEDNEVTSWQFSAN